MSESWTRKRGHRPHPGRPGTGPGRPSWRWVGVVLAGTTLLSSCVTDKIKNLGHDLTSIDDIDEEDRIPEGQVSRDKIRTYYKTARDPRQYWITVYSSEAGPVFVGAHRVHAGQSAEVKMLSESGLPHDRTYEVLLSINNEPYGTGVGRNKKEAQQNAARRVLRKLQD